MGNIQQLKTGNPQRSRWRSERTAWFFIAPVVLGILIFNLYPIVFSFFISFTRWNFLKPPVVTGLKNYIALFTTDPYFLSTVCHTVVYAAVTVFVSTFLSLFLAMLLNMEVRGQKVFRSIYFVPVVIPGVAASLAWVLLFDSSANGLANRFLHMFGIGPIPWLMNSTYAMIAIMIEAIWAKVGFNTVIFLAGLQSIRKEYFEAASIDGANIWHKFWHITLPCISPTTFFIVVVSVIGSIQVFDVPYVMTGGGPANATQMVVMHLYNSAFRFQRMGLASAIGYAVFMIILVLTYVNFRLEKKWVFYEDSK